MYGAHNHIHVKYKRKVRNSGQREIRHVQRKPENVNTQNANPETLCIFSRPRAWLQLATTQRGSQSLSQFRVSPEGPPGGPQQSLAQITIYPQRLYIKQIIQEAEKQVPNNTQRAGRYLDDICCYTEMPLSVGQLKSQSGIYHQFSQYIPKFGKR